MPEIDVAMLDQAMRYQKAYLESGRTNHHRSIPGPLVAEILRYVENSMAGRSQNEIERILLGSDSLGAHWRAHVAHRNRTAEEKKEWRIWYGRYGEKDVFRLKVSTDPFFRQAPPLSKTEPNRMAEEIPTIVSTPLMRGLPNDGRPISFSKMRGVLGKWSVFLAKGVIDQAADLADDHRTQFLVRRLGRVKMISETILSLVDVWETANQMLAIGLHLSETDGLPCEFIAALEAIKKRDEVKQKAQIEWAEEWFPNQLNGLV